MVFVGWWDLVCFVNHLVAPETCRKNAFPWTWRILAALGEGRRIQTVSYAGEGRGRCRKACAGKPSSYWAKLRQQLRLCPRAERAAPSLQSWTSARPESPAAPNSASTTQVATSVLAKRGSSWTLMAALVMVSPSISVAQSNQAQQWEAEMLSKLTQGFVGISLIRESVTVCQLCW